MLNLWDTMVCILYTIYYWKIAKDWIWFVVIFAEIAGGITIIATWFFPESPKFLISKKRYDEAREAINFFAIKGRPKFEGKFDREILDTYGDYSPMVAKRDAIQSIITTTRDSVVAAPKEEKAKAKEEQQFTGSLKDLIKVRRHFINLLILIFAWIASSFNIYLVAYLLKYL
jgi:hypothetical protein